MTTIAWQSRAICWGTDPDTFYEFDTPGQKACRHCPVRVDCLEYALLTDERFGIWGGASEDDRRRLRHKVKRDTARQIAQEWINHN